MGRGRAAASRTPLLAARTGSADPVLSRAIRVQACHVVLVALVVSCSDDPAPQADAGRGLGDAGDPADIGFVGDAGDVGVAEDAGVAEDLGVDGGHLDAAARDVGTLDAGAVEDSGADAGQVGCSVARRCAYRVVEVCVPATGVFVDDEVCDRTQRCVNGACEALPAVYGQPCRTAQDSAACMAAGLVCGGQAALPFCLHPGTPLAGGAECYGSRDCEPGLLCTLDGRCSAGLGGDGCRDSDDCAGNLTCTAGGTCG